MQDLRPAPGSAISQTERVILALRELVLRGEFRAGERLAELTLVRMLNASRTPVRLALDRLAREGVLEALPSGGFRVREFAIADIWDAIDTRGVLEGTAARFAAERLERRDELARLQLCCRQVDELLPMNLDNFVRYLEVNDAFHAELWRLAKSPMLVRTIESLVSLPFAAPSALVFTNAERERLEHDGQRRAWSTTARSSKRSPTAKAPAPRRSPASTRGSAAATSPAR